MPDNNNNPIFSAEELGYSALLSVNAVIRLLEKKNILTTEEVLREIEVMKKEIDQHTQQN